MKKLIYILLLFLIPSSCHAQTMKVVALNNFQTTDNNADIKVCVLEDFYLTKSLLIPQKSVLIGKIANIKEPKKGKRNATFDFMPIYYMDAEKRKYKINKPVAGAYSPDTSFDKEQAKKDAGLSAVSKVIPGSKTVYYGIKGIKQRQKGIIAGAGENIYKHSWFSYKEKGHHIHIKKLDEFNFVFPSYNEKEYGADVLFTQIDNYGNPLTEFKIDGTAKKSKNNDDEDQLEVNYPYEHQQNGHINYYKHLSK